MSATKLRFLTKQLLCFCPFFAGAKDRCGVAEHEFLTEVDHKKIKPLNHFELYPLSRTIKKDLCYFEKMTSVLN
ncbi:hypothetical protein, partial [Sporolactobacillus shoreicorticis]